MMLMYREFNSIQLFSKSHIQNCHIEQENLLVVYPHLVVFFSPLSHLQLFLYQEYSR